MSLYCVTYEVVKLWIKQFECLKPQEMQSEVEVGFFFFFWNGQRTIPWADRYPIYLNTEWRDRHFPLHSPREDERTNSQISLQGKGVHFTLTWLGWLGNRDEPVPVGEVIGLNPVIKGCQLKKKRFGNSRIVMQMMWDSTFIQAEGVLKGYQWWTLQECFH